jgi:hypothetical protein
MMGLSVLVASQADYTRSGSKWLLVQSRKKTAEQATEWESATNVKQSV